MRERIPATLAVLASLFVGISRAEPPATGITVLGPVLTAPAADAAIPVQAGRFVPVMPASGLPIYLADDRAYRVYVVKPGSFFTGIKWDAADGAEPEAYSWPDSKGPVYVIVARGYLGTYSLQPIKNGATAADAPVKDGAPLKIQIISGKGPKPPPDPDPKPDDPPKPQPVTSFRVFLVYESAQTQTQAQTNVLFGSKVESWLNDNCTGGKAGWRRRDKDADGDADPTMAALWKAVKEKATTVPFAAVEVNGKVEIIPLESTPDAMVEKLKTYRGVK